MPESTRRQIGKYQIQAELGRGGFGVVYKAYDPTVGRPVAVKVLTALGDSQLLTRFKNEAAAAGNLRHKNIVTIYDYGDDDGVPYIVMELLEGEDLNQIIASQKPMPLLQKVSIMVQVADGLRAAHRAGVVHRDVKPGNIRLLPDGTVKLMDFGIARLVASSAGTRLTRQGHVIGTLYYMAPEQVLGEEVDALSDIFAYGSTYYELLTGKHPFQGSDPRSVFHKITAEDPEPIRNLVPECPEALEKIVNRTLQKDRDLRYQSLRDVKVDTEPILIELRQERAESLVAEAQRLYKTEDLENAQAVLGEVFDLDPANRDARHLRGTIQSQLLNRLIRPKVEALVKKAEDALSARRFEEGIENYEAAFRLDRDSQTVAESLERARRLLLLSRETGGLVADARRHFSRQNLEEALEALGQVLEKDSSHPEAQQLLDEVRTALTRREKERKYQDKLQQAKDLLQANSFDESASLLENLDPEFQDRVEVQSHAAQIRTSRELFERQQELNREISAARELLDDSQFEAAIKRVELLMNKFPEEVEPTRLFILAHKGLAAQRKAQALEKLGNELSRLTESGHFERALGLVSQSLQTYPAEPRLLEAQHQIQEQWAQHKRETAIRQLLERSEHYRAHSELEKALQVSEAAVQQFPDEPRLAESLASTRDALAARRREEGMVALLRQAQAQIDGREYQQALDSIDGGLTEFGGDERLTEIRERTATAKAEWERAEAIREAIGKSRQLLAGNDFKPALALLHSALQQFPDDPTLAQSLVSAHDALAAKLREDGILRLCTQAQTQLSERRYQQALESIDRGLNEFGPDQRLAGLREKIASAQAEWERAEAVRQVVHNSQIAVAQQDFDGAIALLELGLQRYPGEPSLAEALKSARNALAAKQRDQAIESLCGHAQAQAEKRDFSRALKTVDQGLADYGRDLRLNGLREKILAGQAEWERSETVRCAVADAERHLSEGQPERALESLAPALGRYADDPKLLQTRVAAQEALAARHREQAIHALGQQAQAQLKASAYQNALRLLDRGLEEYGEDRQLADLRTKVLSAKAESERRAAIAAIVEQSRKLIAQREVEKAVALLESAINEYSGEPQLVQAMDFARAQLAAKRRYEEIEALCGQAQAELDKREFRRALEIVEKGVKDCGIDERLTAMREKVLSRKTEWDRAKAIRQIVENAHDLLAQADFNQAITLLESALKRYPGESRLAEALTSARAALEEKRREDAIQALLGQAQAQIDKQNFASAVKTLDRGLRDYRNEGRLAELRERALAEKADWEHAEVVRGSVENAEARLAQGKPELAADLLEAALQRYPADPQLTEALDGSRKALETLRRNQAIETLLRQTQHHLQFREFAVALEALDRALDEYGADSRLSDLRATVLSAQADWERTRLLDQLVNQARERLIAGQPDHALELMESAQSRFGDQPHINETLAAARDAIAAKQRKEAIETACRSAQERLDGREYERALEVLDEASQSLGKDPELSAMRDNVATAKADWERSQAIGQVLKNSQHRVSENDFQGAIEILNRGLTSYPDQPELLKALAETRQAFEAAQKETAIADLSRETRVVIETQDFATALAMAEQGLKAYGPETRLADLRETVLAAQADWQRRRALQQAVDESSQLIRQGAPEKATRLLEKALARFPGDPLLVEALVAAHDAVEHRRREESIETLCSEARRQLGRGKFDLALQQLKNGLQENPNDPRLQDLQEVVSLARTEALRVSEEIKSIVGSAQVLSDQGQREEATALLERALNEHPANPELVAAIVRTIEAVGAAGTGAIDTICRNAREYVLTGEFDLAFHTLERALSLQSDEQQSQIARQGRIEAAREAATASSLRRDAGPVASVKDKTGEHSVLDNTSDEIPFPREHEEEPVAVFIPRAPEEVSTPPSQRRTSTGYPRRTWWVIGCAAALLLALFVVTRLSRTPKLAVLRVQSSPAGATIRVNDQQCSTPTCEFRLQPGQYRIQVSADGYLEKIAPATLRLGDAGSPMVVALEPLSPTIRVSTNFGDGDVVLDDQKAERLQDGQFGVDRLSPGQHKLRVSSREGTASISFDADYAKLPAFTNISQQNVAVLASGSFGNRAVIACSGCTGNVSIDERQVGQLKDGAITVDNVTPGTHRVKVGEERSLVFSSTGSPGINLAVNSNRNFGALVIEANEDNAAVFIDGNKYRHATSHGPLLIPAEAKQHTIRVAKNGYRVDPQEIRVQLKKGDQFQARFRLTPEPARLTVSRQLPGAAVWIDGSPAGTVGSDGAFSTQVPPGDHRIEFRKDGFLTAKIQESFAPGQRVSLTRTEAPLVAKAISPPLASPKVFKPDPNEAEQADWQRIAGTPTVAQLQGFLKSHPAGIHRAEAQAQLNDLQAKASAAAREEAWTALDKRNKATLQQFLSTYGEGLHAQDARKIIATIGKQEADQLAVAERAKVQDRRNASDSTAVLNTLSQFEAAYNRKDVTALQSLWSGMPKNIVESYHNQFRDAKSLDFRLTPAGQVVVSGNSATAVCTRTLRFVAKNGQRPPESHEQVRVTLERTGSQWVIRTISPF